METILRQLPVLTLRVSCINPQTTGMDSADGSGDGTGLSDSFLTGAGQYVVDGSQDGDDSLGDDDRGADSLREQDRFLPIANVARIMKKSIPSSGKIAKETKECVQECVSEFISFITSEASERCHQEKRKTINGEDILFAMSTLGFDNYVEPLKIYLQKYRDSTKSDKSIPGQGEGLDDLGGADDFSQYSTSTVNLPMATLPSGILTDATGQPGNVVYTSTFPAQIPQQPFLG